jgi:hypothetical protein
MRDTLVLRTKLWKKEVMFLVCQTLLPAWGLKISPQVRKCAAELVFLKIHGARCGVEKGIGIFVDSWSKMWGREGDSDGGSSRRGRVKFFPIGVNSANNQTASVASCIYTGTNLKSGTSKCSSQTQ